MAMSLTCNWYKKDNIENQNEPPKDPKGGKRARNKNPNLTRQAGNLDCLSPMRKLGNLEVAVKAAEFTYL